MRIVDAPTCPKRSQSDCNVDVASEASRLEPEGAQGANGGFAKRNSEGEAASSETTQ
jgi:hypothetical protein